MEMHRIQEIHREKVIHHPRERRRIGPIMNHSHRLLMTMSRQYRISRQIMEIVELIPEQTVEPVMEIRGADAGETDPGDSSGTGENGGQL